VRLRLVVISCDLSSLILWFGSVMPNERNVNGIRIKLEASNSCTVLLLDLNDVSVKLSGVAFCFPTLSFFFYYFQKQIRIRIVLPKSNLYDIYFEVLHFGSFLLSCVRHIVLFVFSSINLKLYEKAFFWFKDFFLRNYGAVTTCDCIFMPKC
jgi:hypothetical protein